MQALFDDWGVVYSSGATLEELIVDADSAMRTVDAIVTDFRLPGGRNGAECISVLREHFEAQIPAVIVTGESNLMRIRDVMPSDTVLLQKPFDTAELLAPLLVAVERARRSEVL